MIVWLWLKKHWQWLFPPIGIIIAIITYLIGKYSAKRVEVVDTADDTVVESIEEINSKRDTALAQLSEKYKEKLVTISEEQQKEFQTLSNRPLDEVVAWFDRL